MQPSHSFTQTYASDLIHGVLVAFIVIAATVYAAIAHDHSDNIWIIYGSAVAFAAGRAGVSAVRNFTTSGTRTGDPGNNEQT